MKMNEENVQLIISALNKGNEGILMINTRESRIIGREKTITAGDV